MRGNFIRFGGLTLLFFVLACAVPLCTHAQSSAAALGVVVKSTNANIGNAGASEGVTVYSGDYLTTGDGGDLLVRIGGLSLELEPSSGAHVYAAPYGAVVELNHGAVRYTTPGTQQNVIIVASDVRVKPAVGMPDFGRVSIDDPCNITVYSQRGTADAKVGSESHLVEEGKAYRVRAVNEIDYRQYVSPDDSDYHNHHQHHTCPAAFDLAKGKAPIAAGQSRFLLVSVALIGAASGFGVWRAVESPDRP